MLQQKPWVTTTKFWDKTKPNDLRTSYKHAFKQMIDGHTSKPSVCRDEWEAFSKLSNCAFKTFEHS